MNPVVAAMRTTLESTWSGSTVGSSCGYLAPSATQDDTGDNNHGNKLEQGRVSQESTTANDVDKACSSTVSAHQNKSDLDNRSGTDSDGRTGVWQDC